MSSKKSVLKKLENTYCKIKPSSLQGVGVFAIRDIPATIDPFKGIREQKWVEFNVSELRHLGKDIMKMIDDFCVIEKDKTVLISEYALNGMDISFFLNNSESPNLKTIDGGFSFRTLRRIKKGEELTVSYGTYDYKYNRNVI
ncbi:MAG: SET domain-containing protein [Candidatus Jorgensenbacteria bacterium]